MEGVLCRSFLLHPQKWIFKWFFFLIQYIAVNFILSYIFQSDHHLLVLSEKHWCFSFLPCGCPLPPSFPSNSSAEFCGEGRGSSSRQEWLGSPAATICTAWTRFRSSPMKRTVVSSVKVDPLCLSDCCWWPSHRKTSPAYLPTYLLFSNRSECPCSFHGTDHQPGDVVVTSAGVQ